jgi:sigma-B regulation protein RsbU (phosphoserine phosphatase)
VLLFTRQRVLTFAGAGITLFIQTENEIEIIRGDKQDIGYFDSDETYIYTNHVIDLNNSEKHFFLSSDGLLHQNRINSEYGIGKKRFIELLNKIGFRKPMAEKKQLIEEYLHTTFETNTQRDDITLIGFSIP